jgi:hypothetical protein
VDSNPAGPVLDTKGNEYMRSRRSYRRRCRAAGIRARQAQKQQAKLVINTDNVASGGRFDWNKPSSSSSSDVVLWIVSLAGSIWQAQIPKGNAAEAIAAIYVVAAQGLHVLRKNVILLWGTVPLDISSLHGLCCAPEEKRIVTATARADLGANIALLRQTFLDWKWEVIPPQLVCSNSDDETPAGLPYDTESDTESGTDVDFDELFNNFVMRGSPRGGGIGGVDFSGVHENTEAQLDIESNRETCSDGCRENLPTEPDNSTGVPGLYGLAYEDVHKLMLFKSCPHENRVHFSLSSGRQTWWKTIIAPYPLVTASPQFDA